MVERAQEEQCSEGFRIDFAKMMKTAARRIGIVAGKLMTKTGGAGDIKAVISVEESGFHFESAVYRTGIGTRQRECERKSPFGRVEKRQIRGMEKKKLLDRIKKLSMLKKRERERGLKALEGATLTLALLHIVPTFSFRVIP